MLAKSSMMAVAVLALAAAPAQAEVVYSFTTTEFTTPFPERGTLPFTAELRINEAQVATGAFTYSTPLGMGSSFSASGDVNGFSSLTFLGATFTNAISPGDLRLNLLFDAAGAIAATNIRFFGLESTVEASGTGATASGTIFSDLPQCNPFPGNAGPCTFSGFWTNSSFVAPTTPTPTPVPEPMSLALFGVGLAGLGLIRRKRAA